MNDEDITGLVPEIYYDLIARVSSGVPVIMVLWSPTWKDLSLLDVFSFLCLFGFGYIVGHVLTTVSVVLNKMIWNRWFIRKLKSKMALHYPFSESLLREIFADIYERIDLVTRLDRSSGTILKKMESGCALTDDLLSGALVVSLYYLLGGDAQRTTWFSIFDDTQKWFVCVATLVTLVFAVITRRLVFVVRQDRILHVLRYDPNAAVQLAGSTP